MAGETMRQVTALGKVHGSLTPGAGHDSQA